MIDLSNQVAFVTGGSRGIGAATALMLAKAGADVVISYSSNRIAAQKVVRQISSLGRKTASFQCNLESYSSCKNTVANIRRKFKRIDILVNSGGIWEYGPFDKMSPSDWDKTIRINLNGRFNICQAVSRRSDCIYEINCTRTDCGWNLGEWCRSGRRALRSARSAVVGARRNLDSRL